jgi:uncharacterized protein (DUF427 family)
MAKAIWNGVVVAEGDHVQIVGGNIYFPHDALKAEYFRKSDTHSTCAWKGLASYYHIEVDGQTNKDAAWYYPNPTDTARNIKNHVAFWKGVKVE